MNARHLVAGLVALLGAGCSATPTDFAGCHIDSNPPSAEVWISGEQRDSTPCDLLFDKPGEFKLELKKPGYTSVLKRVTIVEEKLEGGEATRLVALPDTMTVTLDLLGAESTPPSGAPESPGGGTSKSGGTKPYYE